MWGRLRGVLGIRSESGIEERPFPRPRDYDFAFAFGIQRPGGGQGWITWIGLAVEAEFRLMSRQNAAAADPDADVAPAVRCGCEDPNRRLRDGDSRHYPIRRTLAMEDQRGAATAAA